MEKERCKTLVRYYTRCGLKNSKCLKDIRRTWARDVLKLNMSVVFNIGLSYKDIERDLTIENKEYQDILHYDIVDNYQNLTREILEC